MRHWQQPWGAQEQFTKLPANEKTLYWANTQRGTAPQSGERAMQILRENCLARAGSAGVCVILLNDAIWTRHQVLAATRCVLNAMVSAAGKRPAHYYFRQHAFR